MNRFHLNFAIYLDCLNKNVISQGPYEVANRSFRTGCSERALVTNIFVPNIQRLAIFAFDERLRKSVENELHLVCVYFTKKVSKLSKCRISAPFESNRPWPKSSLESCFWCFSFIWYIFYAVKLIHVKMSRSIPWELLGKNPDLLLFIWFDGELLIGFERTQKFALRNLVKSQTSS